MTKIIFLFLMVLIALIDNRIYTIHNGIVIPACFIGCALTGNWLWALFMFMIGSFVYAKGRMGGGDVKLMGMIGAFLGYKALFVFSATVLIIKLYRRMRSSLKLACAPFAYFVSLLFLW